MSVEIKTIGVIGAGQMGAGIAQVSAAAGYTVLLSDIALENAENAIAKIAETTEKLVAREKMAAADRDMITANMTPVGDLKSLADCDL
ncbi:MAG: 3-hydroxyacyl-CoA dehydrogenase NAD-binding domain-containing protein, partial [Pseudomonadota bacterium]